MVLSTIDDKIKLNVVTAFLLKGYNMIIQYLSVPVYLSALTKSNYGIWLTINSIILWGFVLDFGLGNSLRTKLTQALARDDKTLANIYVSNTFYGIIFIGLMILFIGVVLIKIVNWKNVFPSADTSTIKIEDSICLLLIYLIISFVGRLLSNILMADHKSSLSISIESIINTLFLFCILLLPYSGISSSIFIFSLIFLSVAILVYSIYWIYFFKFKYNYLWPKFSNFSKDFFKENLNLNKNYFLIQLCGIVIYSTDLLIVSKFLSPESTVSYNIAYKYQSVFLIASSLLLTPYWSGFAEAYALNKFFWIVDAIKKLLKLSIIISLLSLSFTFFYEPIIKIWVGSSVSISFTLIFLMFVNVVIQTWTGVFSIFLNAIGKLNLQLILYVLGAIVNIPLSILLLRINALQESGVILATSISLLPLAFFLPMQTRRELKNYN